MDYWNNKLAASGCQRIDFPDKSTSYNLNKAIQLRWFRCCLSFSQFLAAVKNFLISLKILFVSFVSISKMTILLIYIQNRVYSWISNLQLLYLDKNWQVFYTIQFLIASLNLFLNLYPRSYQNLRGRENLKVGFTAYFIKNNTWILPSLTLPSAWAVFPRVYSFVLKTFWSNQPRFLFYQNYESRKSPDLLIFCYRPSLFFG